MNVIVLVIVLVVVLVIVLRYGTLKPQREPLPQMTPGVQIATRHVSIGRRYCFFAGLTSRLAKPLAIHGAIRGNRRAAAPLWRHQSTTFKRRHGS
jgi:hypothetical protein